VCGNHSLITCFGKRDDAITSIEKYSSRNKQYIWALKGQNNFLPFFRKKQKQNRLGLQNVNNSWFGISYTFFSNYFFSNSNKDLIFQLSGNAQNVARLFKTFKKLAR